MRDREQQQGPVSLPRRRGVMRRSRSAYGKIARPLTGVMLVLAFVAVACNELPAEPITFENQSDQTITITRVLSGSAWGDVGPRSTTADPSVCVDPDLEALLDDGTTVASRPGPFCQGDPVWVITQSEVDAVFPPEPITIQNQSTQPLTIMTVGDGVESVYKEVLGRRATTRDRAECVESDLEARRLDNGNVVAARPGPFCQGDPTWVISREEVDAAE